LSKGLNIDANRVYSTGLSNGGFMSYDLACGLSTRIAAVASVAGSIIIDHLNSCTATHPMPVMEIHGTADGTVPYNGNGLFAPVDSIIYHWSQFNSCTAIPEIVQVPDINTTDGCTAEHHIYSGGTFGTRVELFKIIGGGHTWPGSVFTIGVTNRDFNASREIWRFLSQYDLNGLITTGTEESAPATTVFNAWPNPSQGKITVEFPDFSEKAITISNAAGQVMNQFKSSANREVVILQNKGIYFISVKTGTKIQTGKIIRY
jgi:polyhydroxybutyrate depolymerase